MYHFILASLLYVILPFSLALDPTRLVYQFPKGTFVENLFVRPSGSLLLTLYTSPDLYLIDPLAADPTPQLIHHFSSSLQLTGITETDPDTYYLIGANGTYKNPIPTPGSSRIYRVHFLPDEPSSPPIISVAAVLADAVLLNGLITLNPKTLLASDSTLGVIWAIDVTTGASRILLRDPLMAPTPALPPFGINGIRLSQRTRTLYFANSAQALLARVLIHANGTAAGPVVKIASAPNGTMFDDFALQRGGDYSAFLATQSGDSIAEVSLRNGSTKIVAGERGSAEIAEPTSAQFGRTAADRDVLYVTTAGGLGIPLPGGLVVGGQVVAVYTGAG